MDHDPASNPGQRWAPAVTYAAVAAAALATVYSGYHADPVRYVRMVSEDQWAEYFTALSFLAAGITAAILAFETGPTPRRIVLLAGALVAVFIAGEEVSWGQRILGLEIPESFRDKNQQNELTLHNLEFVSALKPNQVLAYLLCIWSAISAAAARSPSLARLVDRTGVPTLPLAVIPVFLLYPFVYIQHAVTGTSAFFRRDEVAEWTLGLAILVWSVDQLVVRRRRSGRVAIPLVASLVVAFAALGASALALSRSFPTDHFKYQLQRAAVKHFPRQGMHDQSKRIFAWVYENPEFVTSSTRIHHGRLLADLGESEAARAVLGEALEELRERNPDRASTQRRLGTVHLLLGRDALAASHFERALEIDLASLAEAEDDEETADTYISLARTYEASGRTEQAIEMAKKAEARMPSALLRKKIERGYGF